MADLDLLQPALSQIRGNHVPGQTGMAQAASNGLNRRFKRVHKNMLGTRDDGDRRIPPKQCNR